MELQLRALVQSLTESLAESEARSAAAEARSAELQTELTHLQLVMGPLDAARQRLELEKAELTRDVVKSAEIAAEKTAEIARLRTDRTTADATLRRIGSATEVLHSRCCTLLLHAQEAVADAPKLEAHLKVRLCSN